MKIKLEILLIILHVFIGLAISVFRPMSKIYELALIIFLFIYIYYKKDRHQAILISLAYVAGSDVFVRMTGGTFSYETHKYLLVIFSFFGIFYTNGITKGYLYFVYILLLIPAIFVADYTLEDEIRKLVAFNLSGSVSMAIVAYYLYYRKITLDKLNKALFYFVLPVISMSVYMFFFTASIKEVVTGTGSNFATSGGFGPNQVATILGIGLFIILTRLVFTFKFLDTKNCFESNTLIFLFIPGSNNFF